MNRIIPIIPLLACIIVPSACSSGSTPADNCEAAAPASCPAEAPSYATDVAPLLQTYCSGCHAPGGEEEELPLTSYDAVRTLAGGVQSQVGSCSMPPGEEDQPSTEERDRILAWIVCGADNN